MGKLKVTNCRTCPYIRWNGKDAQCGHINIPIEAWYEKVHNRNDIPSWCPMRDNILVWEKTGQWEIVN